MSKERLSVSEEELEEVLNSSEIVGELYHLVEGVESVTDIIKTLIKEMENMAGALEDYDKGCFDLEQQNKRYREMFESIANAPLNMPRGEYCNFVDTVVNKALEGKE